MRRVIQSFLCIAVASISFESKAADFVTRTYPLSVDVEGKPFQSALSLRLQVKEYGVPFAEFVNGEHDPWESTFIAFVRALQNDDRAVAEKLYRPAGRAAAKGGQLTVSELSPAEAVTGYTTVFAGMKDIEVVSQVLLGPKRLFVWQSHAAGAPQTRKAFVVEGTPGNLTLHGVTSNDPLSVLVVHNIAEPMRQEPQDRSLAARSTAFEYPLAVEGPPVVMQFNGAVVGGSQRARAASETSATDASTAEILRLFAETAEALRVHATDQFLARFTPDSGEKMKQYLAAVPEDQYGALPELAWQNKRVQFIAGSDPVYIAWYTLGDDPSYRYHYVVRDPASRKLQFANINRSWFLDHVLSRPDLFDVSRVIARQAPTR